MTVFLVVAEVFWVVSMGVAKVCLFTCFMVQQVKIVHLVTKGHRVTHSTLILCARGY